MRLFYLILFLIPSNLAKHFILPSSYVSGLLVDYLIPAVYLTDILIIILIISSRHRLKINLKSPFIFFLLLLLPSVIFSSSPVPAAYKWFKLLELSLFSIWIRQNINLKKHSLLITSTLTASVLFQSLLALTQWLKQSSVFGYWFLGEQPYHSASAGIDKITWFTGSVKTPPLGTFPHPNVLAGFLTAVLPLILYRLLSKKKPPFFYYPAFILGLTALFLTFSLSAWLAFLLIGLPAVLIIRFNSPKLRPAKFILTYLGIFLIFLSLASHFTFLAPQSSFSRRSQLAQIAARMIKKQPLTGVGLNNFTVNMEQYGFVTATTRFLQPVHNIFLLILAETGIIGLTAFLFLIIKCLHLQTTAPNPYLISLASLLFIGLFDHYPFTIQSGLILFFFFVVN